MLTCACCVADTTGRLCRIACWCHHHTHTAAGSLQVCVCRCRALGSVLSFVLLLCCCAGVLTCWQAYAQALTRSPRPAFLDDVEVSHGGDVLTS